MTLVDEISDKLELYIVGQEYSHPADEQVTVSTQAGDADVGSTLIHRRDAVKRWYV